MNAAVATQGQNIRRSTHVKKRQCGFCGREFVKIDHLERHIRSHTKEKPYTCGTCGKSYVRSDSLLRHQSVHRRHDRDEDDTGLSPVEVTATRVAPQQDVLGYSVFHPDQLTPTGTMANPGFGANIGPGLHGNSPISTNMQNLDTEGNQPQPSIHQALPDENREHTTQHGGQHTIIESIDSPFGPFNHLMTTEYGADAPDWDLFDFDGIDMLLFEGLNPENNESFDHLPRLHEPVDEEINSRALNQQRWHSIAARVERLWFTRIENDNSLHDDAAGDSSSGISTSPTEAHHRREISEIYRQDLHSTLKPQWPERSLPSSEFLKTCVRAYFCRVNSAFPIIHEPTFRLSAENGSLLLAICSIGSLFLGTADAARYGASLFERLTKSMLASWDQVMDRGFKDQVALVQTGLLGQSYAMLSGDSRNLLNFSAYHGTLITWARKADLFNIQDETLGLEDLNEANLSKVWYKWARKEELKRAVLGILVHDAEAASLFQHEPFLRHRRKCMPLASSSEAFHASTLEDWVRMIRADCRLQENSHIGGEISRRYAGALSSCCSLNIPCHSEFSAYAILEGIGASICEDRVSGTFDNASAMKYEQELISWYEIYDEKVKSGDCDPLGLSILWHWTFMASLIDMDRLELAIGKKGPVVAAAHTRYITEWATSLESKRCLMHAHLLQNRAEKILLGQAVAIHVPRCLFSAAITWSAYLRLAQVQLLDPPTSNNLHAPELRQLGIDLVDQWDDSIGFRNRNLTRVKGNKLYKLAGMLQAINHWGIAQRFSSILAPLIHGGVDDALL